MNAIRRMSQITKLSVMALSLAIGVSRAFAGSSNTNYWVENLNFALTGYVQVGSGVLTGSLPTKQFLAFLSGLTNASAVYGTNADFTKQSSARFLYKIPLVTTVTNSTTNLNVLITNVSVLPGTFVVRYGSGKTQVDTPVGGFLSEQVQNPVAQYVTGLKTGQVDFGSILFDASAGGTYFQMGGFESQTCGIVRLKNKLVVTGIPLQRRITAGNWQGYISGKLQSVSLSNATTMVVGSITIDGGVLE